MKNIILIISTFFIICIFNTSILKNDKILKEGEIVFFKLAPIDPRSLMQGDYMKLNYDISHSRKVSMPDNGYLVLGIGPNRVATFKRLYNGEALERDEKIVHYIDLNGFPTIKPDTFMFEEGQRNLYARAKYGVFKFDKNGNYLLSDLADENFKPVRMH